MACRIQLYFHVHCLAITVEHLVVSLLYMFFTAVMSYSYYTSDDICILACEDEAHFGAFTELDEELYGVALEVPGMCTVLTEILM